MQKRLDSEALNIALNPLNANPQNIVLNAQGMEKGRHIEQLYLKVIVTMTRGVGALDWQPEAAASIVNRIQANFGGHAINILGNHLALVNVVRNAQRNATNRRFLSGDTEYTFYLPVVFTPIVKPGLGSDKDPGEDRFRPLSDSLEGMTLNITQGNPFDVLDVATIDSIITELWVDYSSKGAAKTLPGGLFMQTISNFQGSTLVIRDYILSLLLIQSRAVAPFPGDFTTINGQADKMLLYQNVNSDDLDGKDFRFNQPYTQGQADKDFAGDLSYAQHPQIDALGAPFFQGYTKVMDARTYKGAAPPYVFEFNERGPAELQRVQVGWSR